MNVVKAILLVLVGVAFVGAVLAILYFTRPRVQPLDIDLSLTDAERARRGLEAVPDEFRPRVAMVVYAPYTEDGVNQYSLPTQHGYCERHGVDVYVLREPTRGTALQACLRRVEKLCAEEVLLAIDDGGGDGDSLSSSSPRYDYVLATSGHMVATNFKTPPREYLWRYLEKHPDKLFAVNESCSTSFACDNMWMAYQTGDLDDLQRAAAGSSFFAFKVVPGRTVPFVRAWRDDMSAGYLPGPDWHASMSVMPHNIVTVRGRNYLTANGSTTDPLVGAYCSTAQQVRESYRRVPSKGKLMSLQEMQDRNEEDANEYAFIAVSSD
jgi:hypothetical protein